MISVAALSRGQLIIVRVRARNVNGWHAYSQYNFLGALIETEPDSLSGLTFDPYTSKSNQIVISWTLLTESQNGGSPVQGYQILVDEDGTPPSPTLVDDIKSTYTILGTTGGLTYDITITAYNKYGHSDPVPSPAPSVTQLKSPMLCHRSPL